MSRDIGGGCNRLAPADWKSADINEKAVRPPDIPQCVSGTKSADHPATHEQLKFTCLASSDRKNPRPAPCWNKPPEKAAPRKAMVDGAHPQRADPICTMKAPYDKGVDLTRPAPKDNFPVFASTATDDPDEDTSRGKDFRIRPAIVVTASAETPGINGEDTVHDMSIASGRKVYDNVTGPNRAAGGNFKGIARPQGGHHAHAHTGDSFFHASLNTAPYPFAPRTGHQVWPGGQKKAPR